MKYFYYFSMLNDATNMNLNNVILCVNNFVFPKSVKEVSSNLTRFYL